MITILQLRGLTQGTLTPGSGVMVTTVGRRGPAGPRGLDAEATAADRLQTGLDAATATTQAQAAAGAAASAAQSYQSVLSLGSFNFDGGRANSNYGGATAWNAGGAS